MFNVAKLSCICSIFLFSLIKGEAVLKQLHVLFRHGERSPTETYPNDPHINYSWSGGWGHLTNRGKLQMYELGQKLRTQYEDFLNDQYWNEQISVNSSYADRCLMSAELLAAGLFPPKGQQIWNNELLWQPIPVHYLPRSQDVYIAMKAPCEKYDKVFRKGVGTDKAQNMMIHNLDLIKFVKQKTAMTVNNVASIETLFNTLEIEMLNNLTMPSWVNETLLESMENLAAQNLALHSETEYMKRMKGGVLLKAIFNSMEGILEGNKEPMLYLYSGHDLTIVHVLRSLNLVETIRPSFGACLIFELYGDGEVKINYRNSWNGDVEQKEIVSCNAPCKLEFWKNALEPVLPVDYEEECKL